MNIEKGGAFEVENWPENLYCSGSTANVLSDINWSDTVNASGSWSDWGKGIEYQVTFQYPPGAQCDAGFTAAFWRDDDGDLKMKVDLPSITDPDDEKPDALLVLRPAT